MPQDNVFEKPIKYVKGVGEARAKLLSKLGIRTVNDALNYFPKDYQDRTILKTIIEMEDGNECGVRATLVSEVTESKPRRNLSIIKALVSDGTAFLSLTWFNQSYIKNSLKNGIEYIFFGKVKRTGMRMEMHNPVIETADQFGKNTGRILPVYSLTKGLTQAHLRKITENALKLAGDKLLETLPQDIRETYKLSPINYSYEEVHFPKSFYNMEEARKRLVFEELLVLQLGLLKSKNVSTEQQGIRFKSVDMAPFFDKLSFKLTSAQKRVFEEIRKDMESDKKMNRLVQGDVGSGKTVISIMAIYLAAKNKYQSAFMVPTEILAEQHFRSAEPLLVQFGIKVRLLTGSTKKKEKEEIKALIKEGEIDVLIGTHAILEDDTEFNKLGLVITDEQHRFGVRQRAKLSEKGENPDLLVMTATPIPRTLSLVLYGDLDVSIIDELPPGRQPIDTYTVDESFRERIYNFIRKNVSEGRQVYIICPLVEDSEEIEAESAEGLAERIRDNELKGLRVGLIHGKMKSGEKEKVMRGFVNGRLDVLVSTTVIEVGVNVPNASLMVIENAERFGLSQLHQLRGRVGRGQYKSYCILFNQSKSDISRQRMDIMTSTNDGFIISEKDLELRGPGDVFGVRQHGLPEFKIANLYRDIEILKDVQKAVKYIIDRNLLKDSQYSPLAEKLDIMLKEKFKDISMN
ncbi:MAG: ATP-dependent DNA helicase RecG [Acetivibrionales bacterium]|jgi:ATP-dependent DNA helicase RecG